MEDTYSLHKSRKYSITSSTPIIFSVLKDYELQMARCEQERYCSKKTDLYSRGLNVEDKTFLLLYKVLDRLTTLDHDTGPSGTLQSQRQNLVILPKFGISVSRGFQSDPDSYH